MSDERNARIAQAMSIATSPPFDADTPEGYYWRAKLLEWLAEDEARWWDFISRLMDLTGIDKITDIGSVKPLLLATPDQVAEAADLAIQEMENHDE